MRQQEKDVNALESNVQGNPNVADLKDIIIQLKRRIESLITRTANGIALITVSLIWIFDSIHFFERKAYFKIIQLIFFRT